MSIDRWSSELRLGARALRRARTSTSLSIVALALGLGGAIAFAAAYQALWLAPLPYPGADRLATIAEVSPSGALTPTSMMTIADWRAQSDRFEHLGGARSQTFLVGAGDIEPRVEAAGQVTTGFLHAIGVEPSAGRNFSPAELASGARVTMLSASLATEAFGTDRAALGRSVTLNEVTYTVVGVLPPPFELPVGGRVPRLWTPIDPELYGRGRGARALTAIGRLTDGATLTDADAAIAAVTARLADTDASMSDRRASVTSLHTALLGSGAAPLTLLGVAAAAFLLTAVGNVAGLQLERALRRTREVGTRRALGADDRDLVRQLGAEAVLLCSAGLVAAFVLATGLLAALPSLFELTGGLPPVLRLQSRALHLDGVVLGFAAALTALIAAALTLLPLALARRRDASVLLRGEGAVGGRNGRRAVVVVQVALCVVLVLGAGLLLRSFAALAAEDPGFATERVTRFGIGIPTARYSTEPQQIDLHRRLAEELRRLPGVSEVGLVARLPLGGVPAFATAFAIAGEREADPARAPRTRVNVASAGFFRALEMPILRGRLVDWSQGPDTPRAVVVSSTFATRYLPGDPIGARVRLGFRSAINPPGTEWKVVGVVGDLRQANLGDAPEPTVYLPASQYPLDGGSYVIAGPALTSSFASAVQAAVWGVDPALQEIRVGTLADRLSDSLAEPRSALVFGTVFGAMALLLTCVGVYGALAVETARRRRELAIRQALGASPAQTVRLVLRGAVSLAALGAALGLPIGWQATSLLRSRLYAVEPVDPITSTAVVVLLLGAAATAATRPAIRAARVPPIETIRGD